VDIQFVLQQCPLFSTLPGDVLEQLALLVRKKAVSRGTELFRQGDPCDGFYIVAEGSVKVFRLSPAGKEHVLSVARPGQSFGEAAVFAGEGFPAFAEALEDTLLIFLPRGSFLEFLEARPKVAHRMLAGLSQWLRRMVGLMDDAILADVDTRLARFLYSLAFSGPAKNEAEGKVTLPMQKQVLASHLAMTPPTLSRALTRLEGERLIAVRDLEIEVLDPDGLRDRAEIAESP